uniref:Uncharacterized protein n=1 Tax=Romanomermis culicivorax TaxID=13658 RepID=A0A915HIZ9_ROMCU
MYKSIKLNLNKATDTSKKYYDQKACKREISINDLVLLVNNKRGPFIATDISNIANVTVTIDALDMSGQPQLVAISRLKPFIPPPAGDTFITVAARSQHQQIDAALQH